MRASGYPWFGAIGRVAGPLLLLALAGCAARVAPRWEAPPPPPDPWLALLGEYAADGDTLILLERYGSLHVRSRDGGERRLSVIRADTFAVVGAQAVAVFVRDTGGVALALDGRRWVRRPALAEGGFRIAPLRPVEELRTRALAATPPPQPDTLRPPDLVELAPLDSTLRFDVRYATAHNFMGRAFYTAPRAFLQRPVAEALLRAHRRLAGVGYGLLVFDGYRPWHVTKMFWDATPDSLRHFVADPSHGSRHNRGAAVDVTLYHLASGRQADMPSGYDEFSPRAAPDYEGGTSRQRWHRALLRSVMEAEGFTVYDHEWWHFDHADWRSYPVLNLTFEQIPR